MQALIRLLYALLVAGSVVTFVGFGVYSLHEPPKYPEYSNDYDYSDDFDSPYHQYDNNYDKQVDEYDKKEKEYMQNVTYIVLSLAVMFVAVGLYLFRKSDVVGEGITLGGIATSVYGLITASIADARALRFVAVTILLVSVLVLTYRRFYSQSSDTKRH